MRHRIGTPVVAVAAALTLTLTGCQSEDPEPTGDATDTAEVSGPLTIYAAASLEAAFTDLIPQFEEAYPDVDVTAPVYDGSSTLVTQLTEGAQADVFASADEATMDDLVATGLTSGEPTIFATNTLVIAVAPGNPAGVEDLDDLEGLDYAVCAPEVPCGAATSELFDVDGVALDPISLEQNVTAVVTRVISGEVDAGLVYATDATSRADEMQAVVPSGADQVVNRYPVTTLTDAGPAGAAFVEFVLSEAAQELLAEQGFGAP